MAAERSVAGCILLFAKSPAEGRVKTRLQPVLSPAQSAAAARALLQAVARALQAAPPGWVVWLCADDPRCPLLQRIAVAHGYLLVAQGDGDLGERMARAAAAALAAHPAVLLVGSDCTGYDHAYLHAATAVLEEGCDAVLGPAQDGGYVLLGLRGWRAGIFAGIRWGSAEVAEAQRLRFREHGLRWQELPPRADVDRAEDLWMVCPALPRPRAQALVMARLSP